LKLVAAGCYYKKKAPMRSVEEVLGAMEMRPEHQKALKTWISGKLISAPKDYRKKPVVSHLPFSNACFGTIVIQEARGVKSVNSPRHRWKVHHQ
jgi:hypothetical protein